MRMTVPEGVTTHIDRDTASATAVVHATPEEVFEFIRRPANHAVISGDKSVQGTTGGPERLALGDVFGMKMRIGLPYRVRSTVVELEENRRIAWCHGGKHRWRWALEQADEATTSVTETFDLSSSRFPSALRLIGYPQRHEANVAASVANLAAHLAKSQ